MADPQREAFPPAEAGTLLVAVTVFVVLIGAFIGWLAGSTTWGLIIGAVIGIPVGIYIVYRRYRRYFA